MYIIKNTNPLRDNYFNSNTGEDYIKSPGTRQYHTDISRATQFPTMKGAVKCVDEMVSAHRSICENERSFEFAKQHSMANSSQPHLEIFNVVFTIESLSEDDMKHKDVEFAKLADKKALRTKNPNRSLTIGTE